MKTSIVVLAALAAFGSANAVELVVNGGFESGGTGWNSTSNFNAALNFDTSNPHTGTGNVFLGGWGSSGAESASVSQTINIPAGDTAILTYWMMGQVAQGSTATYQVKANSTVLASGLMSSLPTSYTQFTFNISALNGQAVNLQFIFNKAANTPDASLFLDDVSVQSTPVPEPATMAAVGVGLATLIRRRRK